VSRYDAVLLDAYGTLIHVDEPAARLRASLRRHLGVEVSERDADRAFRAEMTYYADHCHEGADGEPLRALRARCAAVVLDALGVGADPSAAATALMEAIVFRAHDDVHPLLRGLDRAGVAVAVVSNWDCSLPSALASAGVRIDHVFDSASTGASKPDPALFRRALAELGADAARTLHVGDTEESDGAGARAAGIDVRILDRSPSVTGPDTIGALTDVLELL
jgi:HAD superfamily hydrolase (TIGR01549 family)